MIVLVEGIPSPFPNAPVYDYRSLKFPDEFKQLVEKADVIIAVDKDDEGCQTVYGAAVIDAIA